LMTKGLPSNVGVFPQRQVISKFPNIFNGGE